MHLILIILYFQVLAKPTSIYIVKVNYYTSPLLLLYYNPTLVSRVYSIINSRAILSYYKEALFIPLYTIAYILLYIEIIVSVTSNPIIIVLIDIIVRLVLISLSILSSIVSIVKV